MRRNSTREATRIYVASPLSSEGERDFNLKLEHFLSEQGFSTYLPQRDGGLMSQMLRQGQDENTVRRTLFEADVNAIKSADIVLAVLDGRSIDDGVCVELGIGYALGRDCVGFKTDSRSSFNGRDNLMVEGALRGTARTWVELEQLLGG